MTIRRGESGNVFFTLFGAIALVGVIGVATSTLMRGPVGTMVGLNQRAKADSQLQIARKLAALDAAQSGGDCDSDGFIEPTPPDTATAGCNGLITGGGCIPATVGAAKNDPWGTLVGYCGWNHGAVTTGGGCGAGTLAGKNGTDSTVIAVISAGPDRQFQTTCAADPAYTTTTAGSDDIVIEWTFDEAQQGVGSGLWKLKSGDPTKMVPDDKDLEISTDTTFSSGTTSFQNTAEFGAGSMLDLTGGGLFNLPDEVQMPDANCTVTNTGVLRRQTAAGTAETLQICNGSTTTWVSVGGAGGTTAAGANGEIQYNSGGLLDAVDDLHWDNLNGRLRVGGSGAADDTLEVTGTADISGAFAADGAAALGSTLGVAGATTLGSTLGVAGAISDPDSDVVIGDGLNATGAADFDSTLNADGATTLGSTLGVTGATTLGSTLSVTGDVSDPDSDVTIGDGLKATGAVDFDSTLNVDGNATMLGTLAVTGAVGGASYEIGAVGNGEGMFTGGADALEFRTGALRRMLIDSTGDVGINVASPQTALDVGGSIKVAYATACSAGLIGAIRYNSATDKLQLCSDDADGAGGDDWVTVGTSSGGGGGASDKWQDGLTSGDIYYSDGDVGIGTNDPLTAFHIAVGGQLRYDSGSFYIEGTHTGTSGLAFSGAGSRMFFHDNMSAFRAGAVTGSQWDDASLGQYSAAFGLDTVASGAQSFAIGKEARATGANSVAMGLYSGAPVTDPLVSATESLGIFMGNQNGVNLNTSHIMLLAGGRLVVDPGAPATVANVSGILDVDIEGELGASQYCDENGANCFTAADVSSGGVGAPGNDREIVFNSGGNLGTDTNLVFTSTGRLGLGTANPASRIHVRDGSGQEAFRFYNDATIKFGNANIGSSGPVIFTFSGQNYGATDVNGYGLGFYSYDDFINNTYSFYMGGNSSQQTAGTHVNLMMRRNFIPASGNATYANLQLFTTVNQTGGASGISRDIYISSVLTAAADYRAIDIAPNGGYAIYQSGANAKNYFAGSTGLGDTTPDTGTGGALRLDVEGPIGGTKFCDENGNNCFTAAGVAGTVPGLPDRSVQFNSGGVFTGAANFVYTSADRLGFGTNNPTTRVHIVGGDVAGAQLKIENTSANQATLLLSTPSGIAGLVSAGANGEAWTGSSTGDLVLTNRTGGRITLTADVNFNEPHLVIQENGGIGIFTNTPQASLDIATTHSLMIPRGTNAQRPGAGLAGMIRYNTDATPQDKIEYYDAQTSTWRQLLDSTGATLPALPDRSIQFNSGNVFAGSANLVYTSTGRMGIGVPSPGTTLDVLEAISITGSGGSNSHIDVFDTTNSTYTTLSGGLHYGSIEVFKPGDGPKPFSLYTSGLSIGRAPSPPLFSYFVSLDGDAARTVGMERHTAGNTAGNALTLLAGGATALATDKAGGNLVLSGGTATGNGSSFVTFSTVMPGQGAGTTDRVPATSMVVASNALTIPGGTTVQQPGQAGMQAAANGMLRYNTTTGKFEGYQAGSWQDIITAGGTAAAPDRSIQFNSGNVFTGDANLTYSSTGMMGVGIAAPVHRLSVYGGTTLGSWGTLNSNLGTVRIEDTGGIRMTLDGNTIVTNSTMIMGTYTNNAISLGTNNTERVVIGADGNVGIGTANPGYKLTVLKGGGGNSVGLVVGGDLTADTLTDATNKVGRIGFPHYTNAEEPVAGLFSYSQLGSTDLNIGGGTSVMNTATGLHFWTAATTTTTTGTERMTILSGGNVGIGTTAPTYLLSLGGNAAQTVGMERHATADTAGNALTLLAGGATALATNKAGGDLILSAGTSTGNAGSNIVFMAAADGQGAGTTDRAPAQVLKLTGKGSTILGAGTDTCAAGVAGGIRYSGGVVEYCNGTAWTSIAGAATTPGLPDRSIQFNSGNVFTGSANLTYTSTGKLAMNLTNLHGEYLEFKNAGGNSAFYMHSGWDHPRFHMYDAAGVERVGMYAWDQAGAHIAVNASVSAIGDGAATTSYGAGLLIAFPNGLNNENGISFIDGGIANVGGRPMAAITAYDTHNANTGYGGLKFKTNATGTNLITRMTISDAGAVGIGTTAPTKKLHVVAGEGLLPALDASVVQIVQNNANANDYASLVLLGGHTGGVNINFGDKDAQVDGAIYYSNVTGQMQFATSGGATRMTVDADGDIGIGTTAPSYLLGLGGNAARTIGMERHTTNDTAGNNLTLLAGGAKAASTDKAGGDLILSAGTSTGSAGSNIVFMAAADGQGAGTTDRAPAQVLKLTGKGSTILGAGTDTCAAGVAGGIRYSGGVVQYCNGSAWTNIAGAATTPGLPDRSIQFNSGNAFAGSANLIYTSTGRLVIGVPTPMSTATLEVRKDITVIGNGLSDSYVRIYDGTNSTYTSLNAHLTYGEIEVFEPGNTYKPLSLYTTGLSIGLPGAAPPFSHFVSLEASAARTIGMERRTTADTAGNALTLLAGGATTGATNKAGGDLILSAGTSTGSAGSNIVFMAAADGQGAGTADRAPAQVLKLTGKGSTILGAGTDTCAAGVAGGIRYSGGAVQYCNGSAWTNIAGAATTPGAPDRGVQFNSGNAFAASANLTYDSAGMLGIQASGAHVDTFEIRNDAGNRVAAFKSNWSYPQFKMYDTSGNERIALHVWQNNGSFIDVSAEITALTDNVANSGGAGLRIQIPNDGTGENGIAFGDYNWASPPAAAITGYDADGGFGGRGGLKFKTSSTAGSLTTRMTITEIGNVLMSGTGAVKVPSGDTSQRPGVGVVADGMLRYNSQTGKFEGRQAGAWQDIITGSGGVAAIDDLSDAETDYATDFNMFMGSGAGAAIQATGRYNLFIGQNSGDANTTGDDNLAIGYGSLGTNTLGTDNIAIGVTALRDNLTGDFNVAIGRDALLKTLNNSNTGIGYHVMEENTTGDGNTALGDRALSDNVTGDYSTAIGDSALRNFAATGAAGNTAVGYNALLGVGGSSTGTQNTVLGYQAGNSITTGGTNILIGYDVDTPAATTSNWLNIGGAITGDMATGTIAVNGAGALTIPRGDTSQRPGTGVDGMIRYNSQTGKFEGYQVGAWQDILTGSGGVAAIDDLSDAFTDYVTEHNMVMGRASAAALTAGAAQNLFIGESAGATTANSTAATDNNVAIGYQALQDLTEGYGNIAIGSLALKSNKAKRYSTAVGYEAMKFADDTTTAGVAFNTALGYQALRGSATAANNTGVNNTAVGVFTLSANESGSSNSAIGSSALQANTTGSGNTAVGYLTLSSNTIGSNNAAMGQSALQANLSGAANVALGNSALSGNTTGSDNTAVGVNVLLSNTEGASNVAVGHSALNSNVAKSRSTAIGFQAMLFADNTATAGNANNTAVGYQALRGSATAANNTGTNNTAAGMSALFGLTSGSNNVALGVQAGDSLTTGGTNILIGYDVDTPAATTSNWLNIGGAITGDMATGTIAVNGAGALTIPRGDTSQRPGTGVDGMLRYNSQTGKFEGRQAGVWMDIITAGGTAAAPDRGIQFNSGNAFTASADFVYGADGDLLVKGTHTGTASVPASGAGTRMFFDTQMSAFRAGYVAGTQWDNANIGLYSFATGYGTQASGNNSFAMGYATVASGGSSTAIGSFTQATAADSFAGGSSSMAKGSTSFSHGWAVTTSGDHSVAFGREVMVGDGTFGSGFGDYSVAFGLGDASTATYPRVTGDSSFAIFMGDQASADITGSNVMALLGGKLVIDPDATSSTTATARTVLDLGAATDAVVLPGGTDAQRPGTAVGGMFRYNTDATPQDKLEYYDAQTSTWRQVASGGGTPGGSDTQVQFNDGGAFGGDGQFAWNKTTNALTVTGKINVSDRVSLGSTAGLAAPDALLLDDLGDAIIAGPTNGQVLTYNGTNWVNAAASSSVTLNSVAAATASQAGIANGVNTIVWNWALTGATADAHTFGETTAATGGSGDQSILKATTLASSTAVPMMVTNLGNGLSLRVNDETGDADTSPFVVDASGNVGIGTNAPSGNLHVAVNDGAAVLTLESANAGDVIQPLIFAHRAQGTLASRSIVVNNDQLLAVVGKGYDGSGYVPAGYMTLTVDGTPGGNDMPGRWSFYTTADGASSSTERMRIDSVGRVMIGTGTATTGVEFKVVGTGAIMVPTGTDAQRPTGAAGMVRVNTTATPNDKLEFYDAEGATWTQLSGGGTFLSLTDTPNSYSSQGGKFVRVNSGATALEFTDQNVETVTGEPDPNALMLDDLGDVAVSSPSNGQVLSYNGTSWVNAAAAGGATLNGITAATASQAGIANGVNTIVWNWALTGATADAHTFGETTAATGGSGDQSILKATTLASSTAVPMMVTNLGNGLSLRVNDATGDTDTSPFVVDASGNVGIGTATPGASLDISRTSVSVQEMVIRDLGYASYSPYTAVDHTSGPDYSAPLSIITVGGDTVGGVHVAMGNPGTSSIAYALIGMRMGGSGYDVTSPTALTSGAYLPGLAFAGQSNATAGTGMELSAAINGVVDGTVSSGVLPTAINFRTSATDASGLTERMRITSVGNIIMSGTGAVQVPSGDTSQRPGAGVVTNGMLRYNSQTGKFEGRQAGVWMDIITAGGTAAAPDRGIQFNSGNSFAALSTFVFTSAGRMGVGTAAPAYSIDTTGDIRVSSGGIYGGPGGADSLTMYSNRDITLLRNGDGGGSGSVYISDNGNNMVQFVYGQLNLLDAVDEVTDTNMFTNGLNLASWSGNIGLYINATASGDADPMIRFNLENATANFSMGVDDSDGDMFKISAGAALGTTDRFVIDANGNVMIATATPTTGATFKVGGTSAIMIPAGTDAQRPGTGAAGMVRVNTTATPNDKLEFYDAEGATWTQLSGGGTFLSLTDTPNSYSSQGGKFVRVNSGATALEFTDQIIESVSSQPDPNTIMLDDLGDAVISSPSNGQVLSYDGTNWVNSAAAGGATLNGITAATASQAGIANGVNTIVWNWALTGATADAHTFGETTAATGGSGDQSILKATTLASSTAIPLMVTNLGNGISFRVNDATGDTDTTPFVVDASGNVGIGAVAPGALLHVNKTDTAGNTVLEALRVSHEDTDSAGANNIGAALTFSLETATDGTFAEAARIESIWDDATAASKDGSLRFYTMGPDASGSTTTQQMMIDSTGRVMIGTSTATTGVNLKVAGTGAIMVPTGTNAQRPTGAAGMLRYNTEATPNDKLEFYDAEAAAWTQLSGGGTFLSLTDTPDSYSSQGGKFVRVNSGATALEFTDQIIGSVTGEPDPDALLLDDLGDAVISSPTNGQVLSYNGTNWVNAAAAGGGSVLSGITAATADNTIASASWNQTWNWALTVATEDAFTFGETTAATGGSGDQSILKATTLASSTAVPMMVTNLGNGLSLRVNDETGDADTSPFVVDAAGNVGIGIAAPVEMLHLYSAASAGIKISADSGGTNSFLKIPTGAAGLQLQNGAGVIGMAFNNNPTQPLAGVGPDAHPDYQLEVYNASGTSYVEWMGFGDGDVAHGFTTPYPQTDSAGVFEVQSATGGGFKITGITDSDMAGALVLRGFIGASDPTDSYEAVRIVGGKWNGTNNIAAMGATENVFMVYNYGATDPAISVLGSGKVGFGTNAPAEMLHVYSAAGVDAGIKISANAGASNNMIKALSAGIGIQIQSGSGAVQMAFDNTNLRVGLRDASPDYAFEVNGPAASDSDIALSDGDVAHGMVTLAETDVYGLFEDMSSTDGGLRITGLSDADQSGPLTLRGFIGAANPTDTNAAVRIVGGRFNGTTGGTTQAAGELVLEVSTFGTPLINVYGGGTLQLGAGSETCAAGTAGGIRYSGGAVQFCNGSAWGNIASAGSVALSGITAATSTPTALANGTFSQTWNWALTGATADAFTFGETTAATGGSGDQSILKATTLASSTAVPMMVTNLGNGLSLRVNDETGDADTSPFVVDASGNVGIGTASPGTALHVFRTAGNAVIQLEPSLASTDSTALALITDGNGASPLGTATIRGWSLEAYGINNGTSARQGDLNLEYFDGSAWSTIMTLDPLGKVGIGTELPANKLHVVTAAGDGVIQVEGMANDTTGSALDLMTLGDGATALNDAATKGWEIMAYGESNGTVAKRGDLYFERWDGSTWNTRMSIDAGGNVGIGTEAPDATFEVTGGLCVSDAVGDNCTTAAGSIRADRHISANAFDLAERYGAAAVIQPGLIVAADTQKSLYVRAALAGDAVMGITSTDPGLVLGWEENEIFTGAPHVSMVALSGRVPLQVTGEGGSIAIGDRVALSSTPGKGMKATAGGGALVGIALEAFDAADAQTAGSILVFVQTGSVVEKHMRAELDGMKAQMASMADDLKGLKVHTGYGINKAQIGLGMLGGMAGTGFAFLLYQTTRRRRGQG